MFEISNREVRKVSFTPLCEMATRSLSGPAVVQVMFGRWNPLAEQARVTLLPITTSRLSVDTVTVGRTAEKKSLVMKQKYSYKMSSVLTNYNEVECGDVRRDHSIISYTSELPIIRERHAGDAESG